MTYSTILRTENYGRITELIKFLWHQCCDNGQPLINEIESFLTDLWVEGYITNEYATHWTTSIQYCPEGRLTHLGYRSWCAYCGDIVSWNCQQCNTWFSGEDEVEDYLSCKEFDLCTRCCVEDYSRSILYYKNVIRDTKKPEVKKNAEHYLEIEYDKLDAYNAYMDRQKSGEYK